MRLSEIPASVKTVRAPPSLIRTAATVSKRYSSNRPLRFRCFSLHAETSPRGEASVSRLRFPYTLSMCGRYRLARKKEILAEVFDAGDDVDWSPRYNIAPSQSVDRKSTRLNSSHLGI